MEVHQHSHSHASKTWKSFLWEFLMLFLAVFCGFLAENQREHMVEHQREKKYARQLLSDLRADSAFLMKMGSLLDTFSISKKRFDTVMNSANPTNYDIFSAYVQLQYVFSFRPTATTFSEMKSSGSFRYLRNDELAGGLKKYYEADLEYVKKHEDLELDLFKSQVQPYTINHFRMADIDFASNRILTLTPVFINRNSETELQLRNIMDIYCASIGLYYHEAIIPLSKKVNKLIGLLMKEYHLK